MKLHEAVAAGNIDAVRSCEKLCEAVNMVIGDCLREVTFWSSVFATGRVTSRFISGRRKTCSASPYIHVSCYLETSRISVSMC